MKRILFPIFLLATVFCITAVQAHSEVTSYDQPTAPASLRGKRPKGEPSKQEPTPEKSESTGDIKTVEQIIKDTTDITQRAKFGLAATLKAFKEQAANAKNPDKSLFQHDVQIAEELMKVKTDDLKSAQQLAEKLNDRTRTALIAAINNYSIWERKKVAKEWFNKRTAEFIS